MKKTTFLLLSLVVAALSCKNGSGDNYVQPAPGTVVDSMAMPIADDVNHGVFYATIVVDSDVIQKGIYDVRAAYGNNTAEGKFMMPKGGERYKPQIRKAKEPYRYVVGFRTPDDTTFYEYFEVTAQRLTIGMKYLKSYSFE